MAFIEGVKMTAGYGDGPDIINTCSISANRGEIVAILGPNGAGKSTAMKAMLGLLNLKSGSVFLNGNDISKISPQERVKQGVSFVPQTRNVFAELTVKENLEIGGFLREEGLDRMIDSIYDLFPILSEKKSQIVGQLSGGQRQQVALGRALMSEPSVIMVEQNAKQALNISDRGYVLVTGQNKFEGSGEQLLNDPEVRRSFLGG
jgi:branched-chain amino acid transport system ATP-binding protein